MAVSIPPDFLQKIRSQAEKDYPHETCGILTGPANHKAQVTGIYRCRNVQDEYHALDPASFPRTSQTAYFIDPKDLLRIQRETREQQCEIRVIYHSHVNTGAYFSEEDQRIALSEGNPNYPGVSYIVVSVKEGKAGEVSLFEWEEKSRSFVKTELK